MATAEHDEMGFAKVTAGEIKAIMAAGNHYETSSIMCVPKKDARKYCEVGQDPSSGCKVPTIADCDEEATRNADGQRGDGNGRDDNNEPSTDNEDPDKDKDPDQPHDDGRPDDDNVRRRLRRLEVRRIGNRNDGRRLNPKEIREPNGGHQGQRNLKHL